MAGGLLALYDRRFLFMVLVIRGSGRERRVAVVEHVEIPMMVPYQCR